MARFSNAILFSKHFKLTGGVLSTSGLIDPFLNVDTPLFVDPLLIEKSNILSKEAHRKLRKHFSDIVRLISISERRGDPAWKAAERQLDLSERPETALGYGGSSRAGQRRSNEIRTTILTTVKEIVKIGARDPEMISLMGIFEEGVGPDTISDLTSTIILEELCELTEEFSKTHQLPTQKWRKYFERNLPINPYSKKGKSEPVLLVPKDIVRDLPMANDWSEVEQAVLEIDEIRQQVNRFVGDVAKSTISERKKAIRAASMSSATGFVTFLSAVKDAAINYDPNQDAFNYYSFRKLLKDAGQDYVSDSSFESMSEKDRLESVVKESIGHFKHHIEKANLWELCWIGDRPKRERAWQLLFYAISEIFCNVNNVDISPEADMGGGPVDFKFSHGSKHRVLVELKLSTGTVRHGYEKQLEVYKDASRTKKGVFVVLDVGKMGKKLAQIRKLRENRLAAGEAASEIVVIDGRRKASASKRT